MKPFLLKPIEKIDLNPILKIYGFSQKSEILGTRKQPQSECKQVCCFMLRKSGLTNEEIGYQMNIHKTTVSYSYKKIKGFIDTYPDFKKKVNDIRLNYVGEPEFPL